MIDVSNRVLNNLKTLLKGSCNNVVKTSSLRPAKFPTLALKQLDNKDVAIDLENSENAVESVIEIQVFSNKNNFEAKNIINKACDGMRIMGYKRNYGPSEVSNVSDTNIYRYIARFSRMINSVDEIEIF